MYIFGVRNCTGNNLKICSYKNRGAHEEKHKKELTKT